MPIDRPGDPWPGTSYKGFSGGPAGQPEPPRGPARPVARAPRRALMIGGVAAALALGVALGFLARPELIGSKTTTAGAPAAAPSDVEVAPPGAAQVPIAVNPPAQSEPASRAPGRLETLPPEMAAAARTQAQAAAPGPSATAAPAAPDASQLPAPVIAVPPPQTSEPAPAPRFRASFDCDTARPGAEQMVCGDAELAAADRQLARAYGRALRSGVDPDDLRLEQRDWVAIREDAAHRSRRALAAVYDQRIQELNQIADAAPQAGE